MSRQIYYGIQALRVLGSAFGQQEDMYVLCFLSGDARSYSYSGERERKWSTPFVGSYDDVFAHQISWVQNESYWKHSGPSGFIRDYQWLTKIRKALDTAVDVHPSLLDSKVIQVSELILQPHRRCEGMTVREAIENALAVREADPRPGNSDWNCFKVQGPGSN